MIAGTYTPFLVVGLEGGWRWWMLAYVWTVAIIGMVLKIGLPNRFERFGVVVYLALGWTVLGMLEAVFASLSPFSIGLLVAGGLIYTAGVLIYLFDRLTFQLAIWHAMVMIAAGCHYAAVLYEFGLGRGAA